MSTSIKRILVLDAMGVIYQVCHDVDDLLIPFITSINKDITADTINHVYLEASLGIISNIEFWAKLHIPVENEDIYLNLYECSAGLLSFLDNVRNYFDDVVCLSNDVSEWSMKLRQRFGLDNLISAWFISSEIGARKPAPEIYDYLINAQGRHCTFSFFDDSRRNIVTAQSFGWDGYIFNQNAKKIFLQDNFIVANSFQEAEALIQPATLK